MGFFSSYTLYLVLTIALVEASQERAWSELECARRCQEQGYCCNDNVQHSSNQVFSCLQGCMMRVWGLSKEQVDNLCTQCIPVDGYLEEYFVNDQYNKKNWQVDSQVPGGMVKAGEWRGFPMSSPEDLGRGTLATVSTGLIPSTSSPLVIRAQLVFSAPIGIAFLAWRSTGTPCGSSDWREPCQSLFLRIHNFQNGHVGLAEGSPWKELTTKYAESGDSFFNTRVFVTVTDNGSVANAVLRNTRDEVIELQAETSRVAGGRVAFTTSGKSGWSNIRIEHPGIGPGGCKVLNNPNGQGGCEYTHSTIPVTLNRCTQCPDLTSDSKCTHGARAPEACLAGSSLADPTEITDGVDASAPDRQNTVTLGNEAVIVISGLVILLLIFGGTLAAYVYQKQRHETRQLTVANVLPHLAVDVSNQVPRGVPGSMPPTYYYTHDPSLEPVQVE